MLLRKLSCGFPLESKIPPNYLVQEEIFSKDFIKQHFNIMPNVPIQVDIYRTLFAHYAFNSHKILIHPIEVTLFVPDITIHFLFELPKFINAQLALGLRNGLSDFRIPANIDFLSIVSSAGERRIYIN